jgi:hypothetical protein
MCASKRDTAYDKKLNDPPGLFYPRDHSLILLKRDKETNHSYPSH